ncbi:MAG: YybH family protein [Nakamurella sp.]
MSAEADIQALLETYQRSLNTSDADLAASCYTDDGMFMPTTLPTAAGAAMKQAYLGLFTAIKLDVEFSIDELVIASDDLAYALTRSNGTQTVLAAGTDSAESNREVFILRKESDAWKIARYMFNKSQ